MVRSVLVCVYDSGGRPASGIPVTCFVYQMLANGQKEAWTNDRGEAEFELDVDSGAEIALSINRAQREVKRGPIQGRYRVDL